MLTSIPLRLGVEGVKVISPNDSLPQLKDTIADIRKSVVDIKLLPLLSNKVDINSIAFSHLKVNTAFIHEARIKGDLESLTVAGQSTVDWKNTLADLESFSLRQGTLSVELSDTVPKDTTPGQNFWKIAAQKVRLDGYFALHMPGDTPAVKPISEKACQQPFPRSSKSLIRPRP